MVKIYVRKVEAGTMLWTEIPALWQSKACAQIEADGYILNEDGTISTPEPEEIESEEIPE